MSHHDVQEILRRPGASELYKRLRKTAWLAPFLESPNETQRALGARLLIEEMLVQLDPEYASAVAERLADDAGKDIRRKNRVDGRKRAAALWMAGCTTRDIAQWLGVSDMTAYRWARTGRTA